ncbi:hypothetical protein GW7_20055 [Heterocephalus glaber]|uniref:Uncharacterized protein n=1 Tax=Heterocephalus glaber TaxID=10181 RepID=G5B9M0_HETGA|nr:hypothetical protein GW7_20055 [Heterocephalus glaber]
MDRAMERSTVILKQPGWGKKKLRREEVARSNSKLFGCDEVSEAQGALGWLCRAGQGEGRDCGSSSDVCGSSSDVCGSSSDVCGSSSDVCGSSAACYPAGGACIREWSRGAVRTAAPRSRAGSLRPGPGFRAVRFWQRSPRPSGGGC